MQRWPIMCGICRRLTNKQGCIKLPFPPRGGGVNKIFWGDWIKKWFLEFSYTQFFSKSMPFLHKIRLFLLFIYLFLFFFIFFIFLWICIPQLPPNVVSHYCHQMLCNASSRLNVVNWIKKMIIEGGGVVKKMIFGGFIHPCTI